MNLRNYSIKLRLTVGFAIMVVGVITIGLVGSNSLFKTNQIVTVSNHLKKADQELLSARLSVTYFMNFGGHEYVEAVNNHVGLALGHVDSSQMSTIYQDDRTDSLKQYIRIYNDDFNTYASLEKKKQEGRLKWSETGALLGDILSQSRDNRNMSAFASKMYEAHSLLRIAAWEFVSNQTNTAGDLNIEKQDNIERHLDKCYDVLESARVKYNGRAEKKILNDLLSGYESYQNAFMTFASEVSAQGDQIKKMKASGDKVAHYTGMMVQKVKATEQQIMNRAKRFAIIVLIIAVVLAIIISRTTVVSITKPLNKGVELIESLAKGDLNQKIDIDGNDEVTRLVQSMSVMNEKLKEVVSEIKGGSDQLSDASNQLNQNSQTMSQGANEQAASLEEVSTTMEEMVANIQQSSSNALGGVAQSNMALEALRNVSFESNKAVQSNKLIAEKIAIINEIANRTNILALNAAVEAARAGEHGRGFAVVASEVRKLAERSNLAATEIVNLVKETSLLAQNSNKKLEDLIPVINESNSLMNEIAAAAKEQLDGVTQINTAIQQLNQATQESASGSEEMAGNAEELSAQSVQLKALIGYFNLNGNSKKITTNGKAKSNFSSRAKSGFIFNENLKDTEVEEFERF